MDNLLNLIFRVASVEPHYEKDLCLAAGRPGSCTLCEDACPHQAIRIGNVVEVDSVNCSGCGLCVQACPTGALEPKLSFEPGLPVKCSQVKGNAQSIQCLGRLQPTDLLRLSDPGGRVRLAHANCADCPVGTSAVPFALEEAAAHAKELAGFHGRELSVKLIHTNRFDENSSGHEISRRDLFRGGWRNVQSGAAEVLAPLDPGKGDGDGTDEGDELFPRETRRKLASLRIAGPEPEQQVPWTLPRVNEACIMCPSCSEVCPTDAFSRDFKPIDSQGPVLRLDPARCVGCDACVDACPVNAIRMDDEVTWAELSGGSLVAYRRRHKGSTGSSDVRSPSTNGD